MDFMDFIEVPRCENVKLSRQLFTEINGVHDQLTIHTIEGAIVLTSHHLLFLPKNNAQKEDELWVNLIKIETNYFII
jgi:hypothetical protein